MSTKAEDSEFIKRKSKKKIIKHLECNNFISYKTCENSNCHSLNNCEDYQNFLKNCPKPKIEKKLETNDNVNKPLHYNIGIETIDYIESWNMNYIEGNIIKYVTRYKYKNKLEDLKKAEWYLKRLIEKKYLRKVKRKVKQND
jgi:hypothetical protein